MAIRYFDVGDAYVDRYAVVLSDGEIHAMSSKPDTPQGVCMYVGCVVDGQVMLGGYDEPAAPVSRLGAEVTAADVPAAVREMAERLEGET